MSIAVESLMKTPLPDEERSVSPGGRLASLLNDLRDSNPHGGKSYGFFYLTNECNYACDMCYIDSRPGLKSTRLNPNTALAIIPEFDGIDQIYISGGEVSFLPFFDEVVHAASQAAGVVTVFTNGSGFLDRGQLHVLGDDQGKILASVRQSMEGRLVAIPPNVEITLPATEYHLVFDRTHRAHRYHEAIVRAGSDLAHDWDGRNDRPKIRFIVKNTPGKPESGLDLIHRFNLDGLGSTGAAFPGGIVGEGRATGLEQAKAPHEPRSKINGGIHISHLGVFANEPSLLAKLNFQPDTEGTVWLFENGTDVEQIVDAVTAHLQKKV